MSYTNYYEVVAQQNAIGFALAIIVILLIALGISALFKVRRTKQYRKEIMDMYVASKTKKIAKEESLDLDEEYESFKKWCKRQRLTSGMDLDDVIEAELKDKVSEQKKVKVVKETKEAKTTKK